MSLPSPQYATRTGTLDSLWSYSVRGSVTLLNCSCQHQVSPLTCTFSFKTFSQSAGRYKRSSPVPFVSHLITLKPTSNHDMTYSQDLQLLTGFSMTERTGPSSSSIPCAYFPIQQIGFATSKSFPIISILLKGNMLPADTDVPWKSKSCIFLCFGLWKLSLYREQS